MKIRALTYVVSTSQHELSWDSTIGGPPTGHPLIVEATQAIRTSGRGPIPSGERSVSWTPRSTSAWMAMADALEEWDGEDALVSVRDGHGFPITGEERDKAMGFKPFDPNVLYSQP